MYSRDHLFIGLTLSVCVAASVPWLDLVVSLLGAVKMSVLALMAPAVLDMASHWNDTQRLDSITDMLSRPL